MQLSTTLTTFSLAVLSLLASSEAANGGASVSSLAATQYPTTTIAPSLFTVGTSTGVSYALYTQTFSTPLATWAFPAPSSGAIGLGTIKGTIGTVKTASTSK